MTRNDKEKILAHFRRQFNAPDIFPCVLCGEPTEEHQSCCSTCMYDLTPKMIEDYQRIGPEKFWFKYYEK
ncbi:hypothetical protein SSYRP_v1c09190 [Spiroplasma syrphidicola EA-1]|uniref:Uncharacterized protein n=1 Tax=Spiroplasma syrphidicola EA-1 TaxID=1276229 RepID=R4U779_9MOLU|nr:hypothetical protein [Spiroplasma syrphidicola]AGM26508.1 hypothetical protein SSYRP_v1c09190 [Spiroplasma syrphidicola EA-1]